MLPREGALWVIRAVLIVSLVAHVARAVAYQVKRNAASSFSSRTMRWGGITILLFLIWHLINFTIGKVNVTGGATNDPYNLLVDSFDTWWLTVIYLVAMATLGLHLHHGVWSSAQTLGLTNNARARRNAKSLGWILAVVIAGGFSLVPIFVLAGVITK